MRLIAGPVELGYQPQLVVRVTCYWLSPLNGKRSQGVNTTLGPVMDAHLLLNGPSAQPHQFWIASTVPVPRLSTPTALLLKSFRWTFTWPDGALKATSIASSSKTFCEMTVPVMGATLKTLMPVGPEVPASSVSAALPEMRLPTITLSLRLTGGAGAGAAA